MRSIAVTRTVLVVDDIADSRRLLRDMCEGWGFEVVEASDGDEALQACTTAKPVIDAVLVDQFMPRMNGWEFLRQARALPAITRVPIVLVSASEAHRPPDFPQDADFDLVLYKPLDERLLVRFLLKKLGDESQPEDSDAPNRFEDFSDVSLPLAEHERFLEMLDLGRVEAIATWAQQLAAADHRLNRFSEYVVLLCHTADLAALENIADGLRARSISLPRNLP